MKNTGEKDYRDMDPPIEDEESVRHTYLDKSLSYISHKNVLYRRLKLAKKAGPKSLIRMQRWLARQDLYYLLVHVLDRRDLDNEWHFDRMREAEKQPNGVIELWGRGMGKSSVRTQGQLIQRIIQNPNVRICIFSYKVSAAEGHLSLIMQACENCQELKRLFPDIFWENISEAPRWSLQNGLRVKRDKIFREETVEAHSVVKGQPTGKHFDILVYDDVVMKESCETPDQIKKTKDSFELSLNVGDLGCEIWIIGTRYHYNDLYGSLIDSGEYKARLHPATIDGTLDGEPTINTPEFKKFLEFKRRISSKANFYAQMLQNPRGEGVTSFDIKDFRFWHIPPENELEKFNIYILVDPANERSKKADYTVMMVVGYSSDDKFYVIDMVRDKLNLSQRANKLFELHRKYKPIKVGYEKYGMSADTGHIKYKMRKDHYDFERELIELGGTRVSKKDRILRLAPLFEQGRIFFPDKLLRNNYEGKIQDLTRIFKDEEYKQFPVCTHDDMLDCLSRITDEDMKLEMPSEHSTNKLSRSLSTSYGSSKLHTYGGNKNIVNRRMQYY